MSVTAYVLIAVDPGETSRVFAALGAIEAVAERRQVTGPYDIVIKLRGETLNDFPAILSYHIRTVPGVESTTTLVAFPPSSYVATPAGAVRGRRRVAVSAGPEKETRAAEPAAEPRVGSRNGGSQTATKPVEPPAQPRRRSLRCMFPGCGRTGVHAFGFVYGVGRVPLCDEHAGGRE